MHPCLQQQQQQKKQQKEGEDKGEEQIAFIDATGAAIKGFADKEEQESIAKVWARVCARNKVFC